MRLNTFGSRTVGRCCDTDDTPDASDAWSRDIWLLYEPSAELRRLDNVVSASASPLTAAHGGGGALSFGCSRVLFSMMIVSSGRYNAAMRACDDCNRVALHFINQIQTTNTKMPEKERDRERESSYILTNLHITSDAYVMLKLLNPSDYKWYTEWWWVIPLWTSCEFHGMHHIR